MRDRAIMTIKQRETFVLEAILKDENGVVENLTGNTVYVEVGGTLDAADFNVDVTPLAGRVVVTAASADTTAWPVGAYRLNLWLLYASPDPVEREVFLSIDLTVEARL